MKQPINTVKKVILPAAGLGTRFLPATKASPKEMLPIVDKPLIQYAVEEAESCGIKQFIVITGKYKRAIEDHFDTAFKLEATLKKGGKDRLIEEINKLNHLEIAYIRQSDPKGLGHAIFCARPFVGDEPVAVLLSDDVIPPEEHLLSDMIALYEKVKAPVVALMQVPRSEISNYGVIDGQEVQDGVYKVTDLVEKPPADKAPSDLAITGRYILTPAVFDCLDGLAPGANGEIQLTDALKKVLKTGDVYGLLFNGIRYDAGSKLGFLKATVDFALQNKELSENFAEFLKEKVRGLGDAG